MEDKTERLLSASTTIEMGHTHRSISFFQFYVTATLCLLIEQGQQQKTNKKYKRNSVAKQSNVSDFVGVQSCMLLYEFVDIVISWSKSRSYCTNLAGPTNETVVPDYPVSRNVTWTFITSLQFHWCLAFCIYIGHYFNFALSRTRVSTSDGVPWKIVFICWLHVF